MPLRTDNGSCLRQEFVVRTSIGNVVRAHLHFQRFSGIQGEIEHIPGYKNTLADELSCLSGFPGVLENSLQVHPPLACLLGMGTGVWPYFSIQQWPSTGVALRGKTNPDLCFGVFPVGS